MYCLSIFQNTLVFSMINMLRAGFHKHKLIFKQPAGTSRGVLYGRDSLFLLLSDTLIPGVVGIGECGIIPGLSFDDRPDFEDAVRFLCDGINKGKVPDQQWFANWPSLMFAYETALRDLTNGGKRILFDSEFTAGQKGMPINGLVWMGDKDFMLRQVDEKIASGFEVIKLKVGAIDFNQELEILSVIRSAFDAGKITVRLDANGAFEVAEAPGKLEKLAKFGIHSIEQPVKHGNIAAMADICRHSPIPVALDEELIGISDSGEGKRLLDKILPQYIILKPSLLGGFEKSQQWIADAEERNAGWWVTSALESNIGLNAIAQWTATLGNPMPQGLGTGGLYINNITSPLELVKGHLHYNPQLPWDFSIAGVTGI